MSRYDVQKGDRVRIASFEAIVYDRQSSAISVRHVDASDDTKAHTGIYIPDASAVSVEKVSPPLPTTPGSVIRHTRAGYTLFRTIDGAWATAGYARFAPDADAFEVIYDAGAES